MENLIPKMAFTFIESKPDEEIYEICIALKDVCGAVAKTTKVLSDAKVDIRTSTLFIAKGSTGLGYWTPFIDVSKATEGIKEIEENLNKLDVVQEVEVVKPKPLAYDVIHFPVMHGDSPAIIMPIEIFGSLFEEIEKTLMPSGFAAVFYNAGKKSGAYIAELFSKKYGLKGQELISAFIQSTKATGWGQIEELKLDSNRPFGKVRIRRCFETIPSSSNKNRECHWTRGVIAGLLSDVAGKPLDAVELKNASSGDGTCEFEVRPKI